MQVRWRWVVFALLVWALAPRPQAGQGKQRPAEDPNWTELLASMETMHRGMGSIERTGDPDADFARLMLPHHQGAIDMAKVELLYGKDPAMRRLAQEIVTDQQSEIEVMNLWLKRHPPSQRGGSGKE